MDNFVSSSRSCGTRGLRQRSPTELEEFIRWLASGMASELVVTGFLWYRKFGKGSGESRNGCCGNWVVEVKIFDLVAIEDTNSIKYIFYNSIIEGFEGT
jgi:hypothetical protein